MQHSDSMYGFMEEYALFLEGMVPTHKEKLDAILSHDLARLEQSIADQQAMSMRLDQFEAHRISLQEQLGCPDSTLPELVDQAPDERRAQMRTLRNRIERAVQDVKFYNGKAMEAARTNLRLLEQMADESGKDETTGYDAARRRTSRGTATAVFETKI